MIEYRTTEAGQLPIVESFVLNQRFAPGLSPTQLLSIKFKMSSHPASKRESLPIRIAMVGTGAVARLHLPAFLNRPDAVRVTRLCELNPETAAGIARQLPYHVSVEHDYWRLIGAEDVGAALIALPHHLHLPVASELVEAGIPVLVEKPLTCTLPEARELHANTLACISSIYASLRTGQPTLVQTLNQI
jgi:hypothetical protein